ncbi:uncharacterized protein LOC144128211 [Amblyomma americanum]
MAASMAAMAADPSCVIFSVEMLLNAIKAHPILYDKRHLNFKDTVICQKKFKNLKDTFMKIRNQQRESMKSGAGLADVPTAKWRHFEQMQAFMETVSREPMLSSSMDFTLTQE